MERFYCSYCRRWYKYSPTKEKTAAQRFREDGHESVRTSQTPRKADTVPFYETLKTVRQDVRAEGFPDSILCFNTKDAIELQRKRRRLGHEVARRR